MMGKVIDFNNYKKNSIAENDTKPVLNQDTCDFISKYEKDLVEFYSELKEKDRFLYDYLKKTATPNCLNDMVFGKA